MVMENFTIGTADAVRTPEPRNANCVELTRYWNDEECGIKIYCFGNRNVYLEDGKLKADPLKRLRPESNTKEGGNVEEAWAGSEKEAATLTVEIVSSGIERAKEIAKKAKKVIVALGCNPMMNAKEEIDRSTIEMIPLQQKLLEAVYEVNPNVAVVLITNYPYAINWMQEHVPAILMNATGSQDLGNGLAAAIFGEANPAGTPAHDLVQKRRGPAADGGLRPDQPSAHLPLFRQAGAVSLRLRPVLHHFGYSGLRAEKRRRAEGLRDRDKHRRCARRRGGPAVYQAGIALGNGASAPPAHRL